MLLRAGRFALLRPAVRQSVLSLCTSANNVHTTDEPGNLLSPSGVAAGRRAEVACDRLPGHSEGAESDQTLNRQLADAPIGFGEGVKLSQSMASPDSEKVFEDAVAELVSSPSFSTFTAFGEVVTRESMRNRIQRSSIEALWQHQDMFIDIFLQVTLEKDKHSAMYSLLQFGFFVSGNAMLDIDWPLEIVIPFYDSLAAVLKTQSCLLEPWAVILFYRLLMEIRVHHHDLLVALTTAYEKSFAGNKRLWSIDLVDHGIYPLVWMSCPVEHMLDFCRTRPFVGPCRIESAVRLCWSYAVCGRVPPVEVMHQLGERLLKVDSLQLPFDIEAMVPVVRRFSTFKDSGSPLLNARRVFTNVLPKTVLFTLISLMPHGHFIVPFHDGFHLDIIVLYDRSTGDFVPFPLDFSPTFTMSEAACLPGQPAVLMLIPRSHMRRNDSCISGVYGVQKKKLQALGWQVVTIPETCLFGMDPQFAAEYLLHTFKMNCFVSAAH